MSYKVLDDAVEQYRSNEGDLTAVAADAGVSPAELAAELRTKGVALRAEDRGFVTSTRY